jgi:hypothetical protein
MTKKILILLTLGFFAFGANAQDAVVTSAKGTATEHVEMEFKAIQLKDALNKPARKPINFIGNQKSRIIPEMDGPTNPVNTFADPFGNQDQNRAAQSVPSIAPVETFNALADNGTSIPPDVNGAVGTTHIITTLNTQVRIQTRAGVTVSTVSLNSFFAGLSGVTGVFDPKVLFDHFAKRWIVVASSNAQSNSSSTLLAVSKAEDPTSGWNLYKVDVDATNTKWVDYPSLGFNDRWIVVQMNLFPMPNQSASSHQIYVWDKADVYANGTGTFTKFDITNEATAIACPSIHYDQSVSKMYTLRVISGNSGAQGRLGLRTITGTATTPVLSGETLVTTTSTWGSTGNSFGDFAPQLGTDRLIMNNDHRMQQVVVRNGKIWATHNVFLPASSPSRTAVQWWQLDSVGAVQQRSRIDDPTGKIFHSFPSIAVNKANDVLIGYSTFSKFQYASASYSVRLGTDPINTMRDSYLYKQGENTYFKDFGAGRNRWGDYSNTVVDPANDSAFWTLQEAAAFSANTWNTWWAHVRTDAQVTSFFASDSLSCPGTSITFGSNSNFAGTNYQWTFTGAVPSSSTDPNPTVSYANSGRYTVSLTLDGKPAVRDGFIVIATNPIRVVNVSNAQPCQGTEVTLTASQASAQYLWNTGETTRSIKVTSSGQYSCFIVSSNGVCARMSDTVNLVFNPLPSVTLDSILPVPAGAPAFALTGGLPTGGTYTGPGVNGGQFDPSVAGIGNHKVTYTFRDGNNCTNFATRIINVGTVGISQNTFLGNWSWNPNPVKDVVDLNFELNYAGAAKVQIVDQLGRVVLSEMIKISNTNSSASLDIKQFKPGVYYIQLQIEDKVETKKLVIE